MFLLLTLLACGSAEVAPDLTEQATSDHADHAEAADHGDHAEAADHGDHAEAADHGDHASHEAAEKGGLVLALDGENAWQMDEHTRAVMVETTTLLADAKVESVEDAATLGASLQGQLDRLIKGCTMTGASHDQLHVFLMAWMPEVKALSNAADVSAGQASLAALNEMLTAYKAHFE